MRIIYNDSGLQNKVIQTFIDIYDMFPGEHDFYKIKYDKTHFVEDEKDSYSLASKEIERLKSLGQADMYIFLDSLILRSELIAVSLINYRGIEAYGKNEATKIPSIHDQEFASHLDELKTSIFIDAFCCSLRELMKHL